MKLPGVSVCFPAYNEEGTIRQVVEEAHALLEPSGLDYEILVCNDGSRDRTGAMIAELAARIPRMRFLDHERNRGIRETFEHLYREATKDFVFLNSTDGQWETRTLFDLLPMTDSFDVIIASRRHKHYTPWRRFISWTFNLLPPMLFGVKTFDAGAVKLVRREIITRFQLVSRSPFTEAERIIRAQRAGYRIAEHPVETKERKSGRAGGAKPSLLFQALADLMRVRFDLWRRGGERARVTVDRAAS